MLGSSLPSKVAMLCLAVASLVAFVVAEDHLAAAPPPPLERLSRAGPLRWGKRAEILRWGKREPLRWGKRSGYNAPTMELSMQRDLRESPLRWGKRMNENEDMLYNEGMIPASSVEEQGMYRDVRESSPLRWGKRTQEDDKRAPLRWGKRAPSRFGKRAPSRFGKRALDVAQYEQDAALEPSSDFLLGLDDLE